MSSQLEWRGVFSAVTTPFLPLGRQLDTELFARHLKWQVREGVRGIIVAGSLGSGRLLSLQERISLTRRAVKEVGKTVPIIGTVYESTETAAWQLLNAYRDAGASGIMLLPPVNAASYAWPLVEQYLDAVLGNCTVGVMLYSNPAYRELTAEQIAGLARKHRVLQAVKDSSGKCGSLTAIKLAAPHLARFQGLDTMAIEPNADGWVSGMTNFAPREAIALWQQRHEQGALEEFERLYPLLALDARPGPEFIGAITLAQGCAGYRTPLRPPYGPPHDSEAIEGLYRSIIGQTWTS